MSTKASFKKIFLKFSICKTIILSPKSPKSPKSRIWKKNKRHLSHQLVGGFNPSENVWNVWNHQLAKRPHPSRFFLSGASSSERGDCVGVGMHLKVLWEAENPKNSSKTSNNYITFCDTTRSKTQELDFSSKKRWWLQKQSIQKHPRKKHVVITNICWPYKIRLLGKENHQTW